MSWLRSTAGVNKIHKLNHCHIYAMFLILFFAKHNYGMFRGGLETLDLSPALYKILDNNMNQMGYWLPKVAEISPFKIPDTKIAKVPLSLLQLGRVFEYGELTPTTFKK